MEVDRSQQACQKLWGFSDSGDESPDITEIDCTGASTREICCAEREILKEEVKIKEMDSSRELMQAATTESHGAIGCSTREPCGDGVIVDSPRPVSFGEDTILEVPTRDYGQERMVNFGKDSFLDEGESDDRALCFRFSALATIESSKETRRDSDANC